MDSRGVSVEFNRLTVMLKKSLPILMVLFFALFLFAQTDSKKNIGMTIRSEVTLVNVPFSAMDKKGRTVEGLKAEDFQVFDNGQPHKIEYFSRPDQGAGVPLKIALVIDASGSVKDKLDFEIATASEFLKQMLHPKKDSALIIQFDSEVTLMQDFTQNLQELLSALNMLQAGSNTALYDAIYLASEEKLKNETGRKVMIVISDGVDNFSKVRRDEAIESAQKRDVLIYSLGVFSDPVDSSFMAMKKFAAETGGLFFSSKAQLSNIRKAFHAIQMDIQGQYSLAYAPENIVRDGSFRTLELKCRIPGVQIRARKGYYAPNVVGSRQ